MLFLHQVDIDGEERRKKHDEEYTFIYAYILNWIHRIPRAWQTNGNSSISAENMEWKKTPFNYSNCCQIQNPCRFIFFSLFVRAHISSRIHFSFSNFFFVWIILSDESEMFVNPRIFVLLFNAKKSLFFLFQNSRIDF